MSACQTLLDTATKLRSALVARGVPSHVADDVHVIATADDGADPCVAAVVYCPADGGRQQLRRIYTQLELARLPGIDTACAVLAASVLTCAYGPGSVPTEARARA